MSITNIKNSLPITKVLARYKLEPDKHHMLKCPFHDDDKPSMKIYEKTNTFYCFGCNLSGDVIEFIQLMEKCDKYTAIQIAESMIPGRVPESKQYVKPQNKPNMDIPKLLHQFKQSLPRSQKALEYLKKRGLDANKLEIGYNTGKNHSHARNCIIFPLKDEQHNEVDYYGSSIYGGHFYNTDRKGLYPGYPHENTTKLIITEAIVDAATLLQLEEITNEYTVLSSFGTNGFNGEHTKGILKLNNLQEIIFAFDGDDAGNKSVNGYTNEKGEYKKGHAETLNELLPGVKISTLQLPDGEDINSLHQTYDNPEFFHHILNERKLLFSPIREENRLTPPEPELKPDPKPDPKPTEKLDTSNPEYITYTTDQLIFTILGELNTSQLDRMRVTLKTTRNPPLNPMYSLRQSIDLYNDELIEKYVRKAAERLEISTQNIITPLYAMIDLLDGYRLEKRQEKKAKFERPEVKLTTQQEKQALALLMQPDIVTWLTRVLADIGLIDDENNGLVLFLIFLTRFFDNPLHAVVHGSSGSGKTHTLKTVLKTVPPESVFTTTAITENVLFYPPYKEFWKNKILMLEDLDGCYKAMLALREFMSNQYLSKFATIPDPKTGEFKQGFLEAYGPIVIVGATTKDKLYEDNANRSFILHVDESKAHSNKIIEYQNQSAAGLIDPDMIQNKLEQLQNMQRMLKPLKVRNPYQPELKLPDSVFKPLRTNNHYITLIKAVTFLHQYQLPVKTDKKGQKYIETTLDHIEVANKLCKNLLLRKSDELNGSLRQFFERLKSYCDKDKTDHFFAAEVRAEFKMHPEQMKRYLKELSQRGYVKKKGNYKHRQGYEYEILIFDDYDMLKKGLNILDDILQKLRQKYGNK